MSVSVVSAQSFSPSDTTTVYNATATYYADKFVGRKTSNGEIFTQDKYTAAHHSIKFGTLVLVTNPKNGHQVIVRINDRCPRRGIIDLTKKAIRTIGIKGSAKVTMRILPKSYQYAWEHQDELLDLECGRRVLVPEKMSIQPDSGSLTPTEQTAKLPKTGPATATDGKSKKSSPQMDETLNEVKKKGRNTSSQRQTKPNSDVKYDIQLATGIPRSQAEHYIDKLPMSLRENVQLNPDRASGKLILVLSLSSSRKKALATQKTLRRNFPECQIIQTK